MRLSVIFNTTLVVYRQTYFYIANFANQVTSFIHVAEKLERGIGLIPCDLSVAKFVLNIKTTVLQFSVV